MRKLEGKVAIVTGGSGGIGSEISLRFANEGAKVVIADLKNDKVMEVVSKIKADSGEAIFVETNVTNTESVKKMVEETVRNFSKIEILVNNAGRIQIRNFLEIDLEDWNEIINVNLTGAFLCAKFSLPHIIKQGWGRIINISSTSGITGGTSGAHYAASKGGLIALTKALSKEFAKNGVTVNAIAPSKIETDMLRNNLDKEGEKTLLKKIPVGRFGKPEDIASLALFLASGESSYITGEVIIASGGYM